MRRFPEARAALLALVAAAALGTGATLASGARTLACACGGPASYDIDAPLAAPEKWLDGVTLVDAFEGTPRDELRFLAPFRFGDPADSARIDALWRSAYGSSGDDSIPPVSVDALDAALRAGDLARAEREARAVATRVLDEPAPIADAHQGALRRAVELLELAPSLRGVDAALTARVLATGLDARAVPGTPASLPAPLAAAVEVRRLAFPALAALAVRRPDHPRIASLRWVALQERLRTEIPNGWPDEIRKQVPAARWRALDDAHARWLADYPDHPLADLVRLSRVRVAYYEGDSTRAWRLTLAAWPRRLPRVLGELRVLAVRGMVGEPQGPAATDPRLRSAMLTVRAPSRAEWDALWRLSEDSLARPWAVNLQERLLERAVRTALAGEPLPTRFPARPERRTTLWGRLRLVALYAAGDERGAESQAAALGADSVAALVRTRLAVTRRQWSRAAREPLLVEDARTYLVRVLLPDSALAALADSTRDAAVTLGARAAARGTWSAAAWNAGVQALARGGRAVPAELATRWRRAAALAGDTSLAGRLAYARWLATQRGQLFHGVDNAWYRSLGWRVAALRDTAVHGRAAALSADEEIAAIRTHLEATTEPYLAVHAYGEWLARTERGGATADERRRVAREADRVYNVLVNWDATNTSFWADVLARSEIARAIRRAGRG
ncbi:hypothetical protein J421_5014 (plasmid) [Gemmatirosa kalamazoonensis]|uniref:Uncharacterized protein n=1 Tax=Gemmatirosa kalamazoonensis TaxID=861299 RepID=W0RNF0_9BACT|nr:hypothetical protein [Gemmatirosa kalamazoonensis]AHG92549.1 hypothetical protein J421_5014 [Gemmatirosa kalamazoonensis]